MPRADTAEPSCLSPVSLYAWTRSTDHDENRRAAAPPETDFIMSRRRLMTRATPAAEANFSHALPLTPCDVQRDLTVFCFALELSNS